MDVDRTEFLATLPSILKHISNASFISFDLELTGIPPQRRRGRADNKATLQERYEAVKTAAETYQILQIGVTAVEEDHENGQYLIRPFNFNLSPMVIDELDMERDFVYSSSAVEFLLRNGYNMELPFTKGVPYLTPNETAAAKDKAMIRMDRDAIPDIQIRDDDTLALDFMRNVRQEIAQWKANRKPKHDGYDVYDKDLEQPPNKVALNRFQRRLVHQIVRADFSHLTSYGRAECVSVQIKDQAALDAEKKETQRRINSQLTTQIGFRWVAGALAGRDMSEVDTTLLGRDIVGETRTKDWASFDARFKELAAGCQNRRKVLIGHNCFLDFVFFFKFFYGDLPRSVEEFQQTIHSIFPLIYDTKYLATHGPEGAKYRSWQLFQIEDALARETTPTLDFPSDHPQYSPTDTSKYHEAGFDSFVTAKVFLRLAARLHAAQNPKPTPSKEDAVQPAAERQDTSNLPTNSTPAPAPTQEAITTNKKKAKKKDKNKNSTSKTASTSTSTSATRPNSSHSNPNQTLRFSHENIYNSLSDSDLEAAVADVVDDTDAALPSSPTSPSQPEGPRDTASAESETPASASNTVRPSTTSAESTTDASSTTTVIEALSRQVGAISLTFAPNERKQDMLPSFDDPFWTPYKNKLRVFGTVEEVCELAPDEEKRATKTTTSDMSGADQKGWADAAPAEASGNGKEGNVQKSGLLKKVVELFTSG